MVIAGGLAGLAATMGILGHHDSLSPTMAGSIGFDAITVALLGRATPLGTVLAGIASSFPLLLLGRVIQASGTAVVFPLLMTTVMQLVPPARRGAFMGTISLVISVAPALGPTVSGAILQVASWHFIFLGVAPLGNLAAGALATRIGVPGVFLVNGLIAVAAGLWFMRSLPRLREAVEPEPGPLGLRGSESG